MPRHFAFIAHTHRPKLGTLVVATLFAVLLTGLAPSAHTQSFPSKPIRVVTSEPGSGSDFVARIISAGISGPLGQQVIVDNRGAGLVAIMPVVRAAPDGS